MAYVNADHEQKQILTANNGGKVHRGRTCLRSSNTESEPCHVIAFL
jgi:hypothetical protein